ncbi:hypothetical protein PIB30_066687 [Stylosanthes scabra]|uniref:Uncharacterized protein n=1 Tax=Stylosanthes scabra TaxID=79078 RepID=A0ABU6SNA5_9FABA|nr:hypothetical protein [Stylosanthes scabra]
MKLFKEDGPQVEVTCHEGEGDARHTTHPEISEFGKAISLFATNFPQIRAKAEQAIGISNSSYKVETRPKAQENIWVSVVEPPKDIKGKKTTRISVKPLRKRFSQRIIARGGPSRPKPKKVEVIDLVSDEEEEKDVEAAVEQPPLVVNQAELEDEEEDPDYEKEEEEEDPEESVEPEETPLSYSLLSPFPATSELAPGKYDDPHNWNYDGDLNQWVTDVAGGEPTATQDWDSTEEEKEGRSTSSISTD